MADGLVNGVALPPSRGAGARQPERVETMQAIVGRLDELAHRLVQLSPQPSWRARRCMIVSTPFRMQVTGARKRLADLAATGEVCGQDALRWVFELNDSRLQIERRLHDLETSLNMLQCVATPPAERVREAELFASNKAELLKVLNGIRNLIAQRFPEALSEG